MPRLGSTPSRNDSISATSGAAAGAVAALVQNTLQFVTCKPANHVLLSGSRGTGKSSIVKALLTEFAPRGLRLVEVATHDLIDLPDVVAPLRKRRERFVLYVDDFSVAANDPALTALKTALDGGIEEPPENVLIYATSNRRYLMPQSKRDNEEFHWADDELHPGESSEEKISLSERFGLWLSFPPFTQDQYLEVVRLHLRRLGHTGWDETTEKSALRWALNRAFTRFVVGQRLDPIFRQIGLALPNQVRQRLAVGRVGGRHLIGQHHLVLGVHQQVQLVAEPLDNLGHLAVVVEVLLLSTAGLWQSFGDFRLGGLIALAMGVQRRGVARRVLS